MGVANSVLLGIALIGLTTVIVSGICVRGNRFMKLLISRQVIDSRPDSRRRPFGVDVANSPLLD